jgi:(+)-trans-carveol dehydrogenase
MGRLDGKVAFITGAARGQGRSHALTLAREGADIIAIDLLEPITSASYGPSTQADLDDTVTQVEALDRRIVARKADVRDQASLDAAVAEGVAELGGIDIVVANAGIFTDTAPGHELSEPSWSNMIDTNLSGVWRTVKSAVPHLRDGGSVVLISSVAGLKAYGNIAHYVAAKHGVVGLMRTFALELAPRRIRVNSVHPTQVDTPMIMHEDEYRLFRPDLEHPTVEDFAAASQGVHALPEPWLEPQDVSNVVLFLSSDDSRGITGVPLPVDLGCLLAP